MIEERGRVVKVEATSVWVETLRKSTCGQCQASNTCGHGLMNRMMPSRSHAYIRASSATALKVGDEVTIALPEQAVLSASVLVYLGPLLAMLLGVVLGSMAGLAEPWIIALAVVGLVSGFYGVRWWTRQAQEGLYEPIVLRRHIPLSATD
ncbi:SoxR reducing system RseC family protein [Parendozoicomonas haliclonae]|uniref:SoxR reducing system protein RseC n=1 Tax=Parendozoicomonas haliclonae TaxID=1960125 RepID=A0A1X7AQT6_9GAMM|nr:SoxR reducing system RseC family protein [Parendozoicomonas haliclonae]SMA50450.1 SoxR reducing system protein RseC [Parendozoicomonas haliclonae]